MEPGRKDFGSPWPLSIGEPTGRGGGAAPPCSSSIRVAVEDFVGAEGAGRRDLGMPVYAYTGLEPGSRRPVITTPRNQSLSVPTRSPSSTDRSRARPRLRPVRSSGRATDTTVGGGVVSNIDVVLDTTGADRARLENLRSWLGGSVTVRRWLLSPATRPIGHTALVPALRAAR